MLKKCLPCLKQVSVQRILFFLLLLGLTSACSRPSEAEPSSPKNQAIAVDVEEVQLSEPAAAPEYTGSTAPIKEVSVRAQTQGKLLSLQVEVGDRVEQGQLLGNIDDELLASSVNQALAQREAQISEVASARSKIGEVSTQVEQARLAVIQAEGNLLQLRNSLKGRIENARLQAQQTQADAKRLNALLQSGVVTTQAAEQAQTLASQAQQTLNTEIANSKQQIIQAETAVKTARQVLESAQAQVSIEQQNAEAARRRVLAQQAVVDQSQKQQANARITAPMAGVVMTRITEKGSVLQPGNEILTLGDFRQVKVIVDISERLLPQVRIGQKAQVKLDAFPKEVLTGKITRISPLADQSSRLLPVEIVIPNPTAKIGSGLLARVSFVTSGNDVITVPETAIQTNLVDPKQQRRSASTPSQTSTQPKRGFRAQRSQKQSLKPGQNAWVFVVTQEDKPTVQARSVTLGDRINGQVEIRSGLSVGDKFVSRSSQLLTNGAQVQLSAISRPTQTDKSNER